MNYEIGYRYLYELKQTATHPLTLVRFIGSSAAAHIGIEFGVKGPTYGMTSACASAAHAIEVGRDYIRHGLVDIAIVGASDAPLTYGMMQAFEATGLLSPQGIYPYAKKRNGTVLGEGAGILVLESMRHARLRGAKVLAELCGVGMSIDSTDLMNPDVDGPCEAMRSALEDAQIAPSDIDYVNAHGIGMVANDRNETQAMRKVFGNRVASLAVSSTKSMYGHPLGASSSIGAVACIKAMQESWVPPTMGLDEPDPECDLDYVANAGREKKLTYTMANAFAYTGINASLVFGPPPA
jgi:nodulation protein E